MSAAAWVYVQSGSSHERLYTVGFYDPSGRWNADSDHRTEDAAAARVHYLNGGANAKLVKALREVLPGAESMGWSSADRIRALLRDLGESA